jgi:hypothetical protein
VTYLTGSHRASSRKYGRVHTLARPGHRDVEKVRPAGGPIERSFLEDVSTQYQEDDVAFLALVGVDRADVEIREITAQG